MSRVWSSQQWSSISWCWPYQLLAMEGLMAISPYEYHSTPGHFLWFYGPFQAGVPAMQQVCRDCLQGRSAWSPHDTYERTTCSNMHGRKGFNLIVLNLAFVWLVLLWFFFTFQCSFLQHSFLPEEATGMLDGPCVLVRRFGTMFFGALNAR